MFSYLKKNKDDVFLGKKNKDNVSLTKTKRIKKFLHILKWRVTMQQEIQWFCLLMLKQRHFINASSIIGMNPDMLSWCISFILSATFTNHLLWEVFLMGVCFHLTKILWVFECPSLSFSAFPTFLRRCIMQRFFLLLHYLIGFFMKVSAFPFLGIWPKKLILKTVLTHSWKQRRLCLRVFKTPHKHGFLANKWCCSLALKDKMAPLHRCSV